MENVQEKAQNKKKWFTINYLEEILCISGKDSAFEALYRLLFDGNSSMIKEE